MTPQGEPLTGAIVTLWDSERRQKLSVYSDGQGHFDLNAEFTGATTLRGRSPYYRDKNIPLEITKDTVLTQDLVLDKMTDLTEISSTLPASAHVTKLDFSSDEERAAFISQCNYCHQQGNSFTRAPRPDEAWSDTVSRMEGYGSYLSYKEHKDIVQTLHKGFDGAPTNIVQRQHFSDEQAQAVVHEWLVATPVSFLHDTIIGQNGKLYGIDEGADTIWELDRDSGEVIANKIPNTEGLPEGGNFEGFQLPIGIFSGHYGPHSAVQISDGRMYITSALASSLLMFNPEDRSWKNYPIPRGFLWRKGLYSHTIRADKDENVWFTMLASNMVLKFDTKTEKFTEIDLPSNDFIKWMSDVFMGAILKIASFFPKDNLQLFLSHHKWLNGGRGIFNWPYGIDINPVDGSIWYGKLLGDKIGRIDPVTLDIVEFDTPAKGPRRMRFDQDGILWIPSFDEGKLMRFDPKAESFELIDLPLLSDDEYEVPYALNVHDHTGDVWIAANNSDRVLRYIPEEKRFISYPMPSRVVWYRDFEFTKDGQVCTSNSNLPAYAHEDGLPSFMCLDPQGNSRERVHAHQ